MANNFDEEEVRMLLQRYDRLLNPREKEVLSFYYLSSDQPKKLAEFSSTLGISGSRVREIRDKALRKLYRAKRQNIIITADDITVYELNINYKFASRLLTAGYVTVKKIMEIPRVDIIKTRNIGPNVIKDLAKALKEYGYELGLTSEDYYYYMKNGKIPDGST